MCVFIFCFLFFVLLSFHYPSRGLRFYSFHTYSKRASKCFGLLWWEMEGGSLDCSWEGVFQDPRESSVCRCFQSVKSLQLKTNLASILKESVTAIRLSGNWAVVLRYTIVTAKSEKHKAQCDTCKRSLNPNEFQLWMPFIRAQVHRDRLFKRTLVKVRPAKPRSRESIFRDLACVNISRSAKEIYLRSEYVSLA